MLKGDNLKLKLQLTSKLKSIIWNVRSKIETGYAKNEETGNRCAWK